MSSCRICLRNFKKLAYQTKHISICRFCIDELNTYPEPAKYAETRLGELLRKGMGKRNPNYTEAAYQRALPGWLNRLLSNKGNTSRDFKVVRAHRRGLLRVDGSRQWDYPRDWIDRARRIRARDQCCQSCGKTDVPLDVHHIIYLTNYGTNQQANLASLCRPCHEKEHGREFDFGEAEEPGNPSPIRPPKPPHHEPPHAPPKPPAPIDKRRSSVTPDWVKPDGAPRTITKDWGVTNHRNDTPHPPPKPVPPPSLPPEASVSHIESPNKDAPPVKPYQPTPQALPPSQIKANKSVPKLVIAILVLCIFLFAMAIIIGNATNIAVETKIQHKHNKQAKTINEELKEIMANAIREYPYIQTEHGMEATREIIEVRNKLLAQGISPTNALQMAIKEVAPKHDPRKVGP